MNLYKAEIRYGFNHALTNVQQFYVVADSINEAQSLACDTFREYRYGDFYFHSIEKIAEEGQYAKPNTLLVQPKIKT